MDRGELAVGDGVELAHALVFEAAKATGIKILFIKGPSLNELGLRARRPSTDVDVLVEPLRHHELVSNLSVLGWEARLGSSSARILPQHATHLIHPAWPCDIDVHDAFPGFFATSSVIFETLWQSRELIRIAGVEVPCPNRVGSALIAAIHALREPSKPRNVREFAYLVEVARNNFSSEELHHVAELTKALRAQETLTPFTSRIGMEAPGRDLTKAERRLWLMRVSDQTRSLAWLNELISASWGEKGAVLYHALVPPTEEISASYDLASPTKLRVMRLRVRRLVHGTVSLARALAAYKRNRSAVKL